MAIGTCVSVVTAAGKGEEGSSQGDVGQCLMYCVIVYLQFCIVVIDEDEKYS